MSYVADRVKETSTTIGTGTLNLNGAVSRFQGFVAAIGTGNPCYYAIVHQSAAEWEVGIGTVTDAAPDTLSRTTVLASSNAGSLVNLSAGTKDVFVTIPASKIDTVSVASKTTTYTALTTDDTIIAASGTFTITLYAASGNSGRTLNIKNAGTGVITIDANASETIDGALTQTISAQYTNLQLRCDGTNWHIL